MRMILPLLVLLMAPVCRAGPAEQVYFTARDQAIATLEQKFNSLEPAATDKFQAEYDRASGAVEAQLRRLMGPVPPPKGFSSAGTMSPQVLCCGIGAGTLDGALFRNGDDIVLVTTEGLLRHWLEENSKAYHFPTDPAAALRSDDFYTPAIAADAAVSIFAPLPIRAPRQCSRCAARRANPGAAGLAAQPDRRLPRQGRLDLHRARRADTEASANRRLRCGLEGTHSQGQRRVHRRRFPNRHPSRSRGRGRLPEMLARTRQERG
ncbi:MAG TPA: hypothetical protein VI232_24885, partial [Reyranella sp.]